MILIIFLLILESSRFGNATDQSVLDSLYLGERITTILGWETGIWATFTSSQ